MHTITPIPAFDDNYIWLLENADGTALVVDPGEAGPVEDALAARGLTLAGILITHHHFDHVGGLKELKAAFACDVYGPDNPTIAGIDHALCEGDVLDIGDYSFSILETPGHTLDHIAYFQRGHDAQPPLLFCGDTLFAAGCGRMFEGTPPMMYESLHKLGSLPTDTRVYCTHEYTLANLAFARAADPNNQALAQREEQAKATRASGVPTLPSSIGLERTTNPFLRSGDAGIQAQLSAAGKLAGASATRSDVECFAALRQWKDNF